MNPFGTTISAEDIVDALSFFDGWEDRYKYIIDLGKQLPEMAAELKTDERLVKGCQSKVWIEAVVADDGKLALNADSDAFIVKGLLAVVLAAYNGKTPQQACAFDVETYFSQLHLLNHLSPTRSNGLQAMVQKLKEIAAQHS